jgi:phosphoribosylamine--glycine ligase
MAPPIMPTRILIVGSGGREHALAWKLASEPGVNRVVVAPGSAGIALEARVACVRDVTAVDVPGLVDLARREAVELAVIGPEAALAAGVVDALVGAGVPTFGPTEAAARIETSKAFCRDVANAAGVPMARGDVFDDAASAARFAGRLAAEGRGVVVKADGLAAGKGVTVCDDLPMARDAIDRLFTTAAGARVVVEERLAGAEASLIAITDGRASLALPPARDHKRLGDDDQGPNTGGMGAYSPLTDLADDAAADLVERFHKPILAELARRGSPFCGALYAGLMLTQDGPRLLECNARFGDPETQALLPRLGTALGPLLLSAARGQLGPQVARLGTGLFPATRQASVAVVLAAAGYPGPASGGDAISGLEAAREHALVFHSGTRRDADGTWRTAGGRILTVVGRGRDLSAARDAADRGAALIRFAGAQRRTDIGRHAAAMVSA